MSAPPSEPPARGEPPPVALRLAAVVVAIEGLGLLVIAAIDVARLVAGESASRQLAGFGALLIAVSGAALLALARALLRRRTWAQAPVIVVQLLALPVGYSLAVQAGHWVYGGPLLVLGIGELVLLATPQARAALRRGGS